MTHTNRPLSDKIGQVIKFCSKFNESKTRYPSQVYHTHYYAEDGLIKEIISSVTCGLIIYGTYTRDEIIKLFIDYFSLYEGNDKDGTTGL